MIMAMTMMMMMMMGWQDGKVFCFFKLLFFVFSCVANYDRSHHQKNRPSNQQTVDDDTAHVEERSYDDDVRSDTRKMKSRWNGIMGDLIAGAADMSFAPLTVSK
jgi:hypothetical protein